MEEENAMSKWCPASTVAEDDQGSAGLSQTLPPVEDAFLAPQEPQVICQEIGAGGASRGLRCPARILRLWWVSVCLPLAPSSTTPAHVTRRADSWAQSEVPWPLLL